VQKAYDALDHQSGAGQQHHGQGKLNHHQRPSSTHSFGTWSNCTPAFLENPIQVGPDALQRRRKPERDSSTKAKKEGKTDYRPIEADGLQARYAFRHQRVEQVDTPESQEQTQGTADEA